MNFARVLAALRSHGNEALTVVVLAALLETTARNIDYWITRFDLPRPFFQPPDRQRFWHPQEVIRWVLQRERIARESIGIEQITVRTGLSATRWRAKVRAGEAPASIAHELGTGRKLWWICEVDAYLVHLSGGVRLPKRIHRVRNAALAATRRVRSSQ